MKKTLQALLIPTNGNIAYTITKNDDGQLVTVITNSPGYSFHLYLTSNDLVKKGDKVLYESGTLATAVRDIPANKSSARKIVATTNEQLNLPFIPPAFRHDYAKSSGNINELEIELESDTDCNATLFYRLNGKPQLASINLSESEAPDYYGYDWSERLRPGRNNKS